MSDAPSKPASASVAYNPGLDDPVEVTWGGKRFVKGQAVTVEDPHLIALARTNPHFNVDGEDKVADAAKRSERDFEDNRKATIAAFEAEEEALMEAHKGQLRDLQSKQNEEHDAFEQRRAAAMGAFQKDRPKPDNAPKQAQPQKAAVFTGRDPNPQPAAKLPADTTLKPPESGVPAKVDDPTAGATKVDTKPSTEPSHTVG